MKMSRVYVYRVVPVIAALVLTASSIALAQSPQQRVHSMSHSVMPFDMSKTIHVFKLTESGGIERVLVRDSRDVDQIALIQRHLKHEAERFRRGDYSDPAKLHGRGMPGLKALEANASQIKISYSELPQGAEITFTTSRLKLLTAIHRWFGAQLSEHGADARAE
ncbi:hypothetical protein QQM79_20495 [Marinobacteraceae bacterium S3BR75-40.1]